MRLPGKTADLFRIALITVFVSGCAFNSTPPDTPDPVEPGNTLDALAARDVVSVLRQIDTLAPERTTLGPSSENLGQDQFADALKRELEAAGYAMRIVGNAPDTIPVSFEVRDEQSDDDSHSRTLTVFAGDVAVRRTYTIDSTGAIKPLGSMQVRGADARNLVLDNNIFSVPTDAPAEKEPPVETAVLPDEQLVLDETVETAVLPDEQLVLDETSTTSGISSAGTDDPPSMVTPSSQAGLNTNTTISSSITDHSLLDLVAPSVPAPSQDVIDIALLRTRTSDTTENFMNLRQSNFANVFADMGIVSEKVLTFPNDSTFMGSENKARLSAMLDSFNAQSDVLSVIGCSMGATNHVGGQEALARGRASRVRDELLYAGIPEENILEEGCWAEEAFDQRMPRRGVVVTLKRRLG